MGICDSKRMKFILRWEDKARIITGQESRSRIAILKTESWGHPSVPMIEVFLLSALKRQGRFSHRSTIWEDTEPVRLNYANLQKEKKTGSLNLLWILEIMLLPVLFWKRQVVVLQAETGIHWITERRPLLLLQTKKKTGKNFLRLSLLSLMNINIRGDSFCARMSKLWFILITLRIILLARKLGKPSLIQNQITLETLTPFIP